MPKVTIPIGPQHPALKEPENFTAIVDGETVVDLVANIGFNHRGIEKACEERNYVQILLTLERICGICSHSHATCCAQGIEELMGLEAADRGIYIRTIICELERIHSHLLWTGVAAHEMGWDTVFMYTWRDRELVQNALEEISGNRCNYAMNSIGGARRDVSADMGERLLKLMDVLEAQTKYYTQVATTETSLLKRCQDVGVLKNEWAVRLNAVGPTARASNVDADVRRDDPNAAYDRIDFDVITYHTGDVFARVVVRVLELMQSYRMMRQLVKEMPKGDISSRKPGKAPKVPEGEVVSRYEAPRGEDIHYIRSNGTDKPARYKIRAPTLGNIPSIVAMSRGNRIADLPLCIAGIDPCFSCTDRITLVDRKRGVARTTTMDGVRVYARRIDEGWPSLEDAPLPDAAPVIDAGAVLRALEDRKEKQPGSVVGWEEVR